MGSPVIFLSITWRLQLPQTDGKNIFYNNLDYFCWCLKAFKIPLCWESVLNGLFNLNKTLNKRVLKLNSRKFAPGRIVFKSCIYIVIKHACTCLAWFFLINTRILLRILKHCWVDCLCMSGSDRGSGCTLH